MTDRSYRVRLEANVAGFIAQVAVQAVAAVGKLENAAEKAGKQIDQIGDGAKTIGPKVGAGVTAGISKLDKLAVAAEKNSQHLETVGGAATKMGIVVAAGVGLAAKAAIDWESAWAGVTKTVSGSAEQMAELEDQLRGMAKTLPATHTEIAAVAEAAGQLGVKREDIASFTRVMVDLGETTNLSADAAATSLAQFMNVMQTAPGDVGRLGAAIVALGNDGASTEADIVSMAQRIAGVGRVVGLSETQVLGYASALANVGIEAEAGGSAISTLFFKIDTAVSEGGDSLEGFAQIAGVTSQQFKQQFETDASGAAQLFFEGLGRINAAGGDVNKVLTDLGITEIRQRDATLRLASSGTNLADSLKVSADGWRENSALVDEAAKRYATTESQIKIAWNGIKDAAITAGAEMLPAIRQIAESVADVAEFFGDLPAPVRQAATTLLLVVGAAGLVTGGVLKMVTSVAAARTAMVGLAGSSKAAGAAMGTLGKAGVAGLAIVGLLGVVDAVNKFKAATSAADVSKLSGDLIRLGATGKSTGELMKNFGSDFSGVDDIFGRKGVSLATAMKNVSDAGDGLKGKLIDIGVRIPQATHPLAPFNDELGQSRDRVKELDQALSALVEGGNQDAAGAAFEQLATQAGTAGVSIDQLKALFPEYGRAVEAAGVDAQVAGEKAAGAAPGNEALAGSLDSTADSAEDASKKLKDYIAALFLVPNLVLGVRDAQRGVQAAIDGATASIKENGRTLNIGTEKGRANQAALDAIATSANNLSEAYLNSNASQKQITAGAVQARASFVETAVKMGLTRAAAKSLADQLIKIPDKKQTEVSNNAAGKPLADAKTYAQVLQGTLPTVKTFVTTNAAGPPKTAAERYAEILRGTLPTVKTSVTNTAPAATKVMDFYKDSLALTPKSKSTTISTPGAVNSQSQVGGLLGLLGALPSSKSVTINTYKNMIETVSYKTVGVKPIGQADGGYYPEGVPSYADGKMPDQAMIQQAVPGGIFQWAEEETEGEAFIPLAESKRARSTKILAQVAKAFGLDLVRSFADGGFSAPGGRLVDIAYLLRQLGVPFSPTAGANFSGTLAAKNKASALVTASSGTLSRAEGRETAAKLEVDRITKALAANKKSVALQNQLAAAKKRLAAATVATNNAEAVYKRRADASATATKAHQEAIEKLIAQQKEAVELADQIARGLTSGAGIGDLFEQSLTGKGLLADLQGKGTELAKFRGQIDALRKRGLSQDLIDQIIGKGSEDGGELAQAILDGGAGLVAALNKAQKALDAQANLIGAGVAASKYGVKIAGARKNGGKTEAFKDYAVGEDGPEILRMGAQPGWVYPNAVDPNRYVRPPSAATGSGGGATPVTKVTNVHQHNTFNGMSPAEADRIAARANAKVELAAKGY